MRKPTDHELRDSFVRDYRRNAERMGQSPDLDAIEKLVRSDLELVDAFEREQKPASPRKPKPAAKPRCGELEKELAEKGLKVATPKQRAPDPVLDTAPRSEKAVAAFRRIRQILMPRGSVATVAVQKRDMHDALAELTDPALAREFLELWSWYGPLRSVASKKNPFLWLNAADAAAKFKRGIEDICDRSTAKFGPWWVK